MKAWLIHWDGTNIQKYDPQNIVSILSSRLSGHTVKQVMEQRYVDSLLFPERIAYAKNKRDIRYPAKFADIKSGDQRVPYSGRIVCGHNPFLVARLVENIEVVVEENGYEKLIWKDKPIPKHL